MEDKSYHLQILEKLSHKFDDFDMTFNASSKLYRLSVIFEILHAKLLFDELLQSWSHNLPLGDGPDSDVDFELWSNNYVWNNLIVGSQQSACIDNNVTIDLGNGFFLKDYKKQSEKLFIKQLKNVVKQSKYNKPQNFMNVEKFANDGSDDVMDFGNLVFYAVNQLLLSLKNIDNLLKSPDPCLFPPYYDVLNRTCEKEIDIIQKKIKEIEQEDIQERRKSNKLRGLFDDIKSELTQTDFLNPFIKDVNEYDISDFKSDNPNINKSDEEIRQDLALNELIDENFSPNKQKIGKHLFVNRKAFDKHTIQSFFIYVYVGKELSNLNINVKSYNNVVSSHVSLNNECTSLSANSTNVYINSSKVTIEQTNNFNKPVNHVIGVAQSLEGNN